MTLPLPKPPGWMKGAACKGLAFPDVDPWHHEVGEADLTRIAKRICASCPVMDQCREYGDTIPNAQGIWGGRSIRAAHRTDRRRSA